MKPEKRMRQVSKDSEATWTVPKFFSFSYDGREYEQDLQSSENQNITFLTLRSQNGVESQKCNFKLQEIKTNSIINLY